MTDLIIGLGQIGKAIKTLLEQRNFHCEGIDIKYDYNFEETEFDFMHICIPYSHEFPNVVKNYKEKFKPKNVIIHSTVKPGTSLLLRACYSPVRGVHGRMIEDLEYYSKWYATNKEFNHQGFIDRFVKVKLVQDSTELEYTKILVDTTYYGWLIAFRKIVDNTHSVYWGYADEIHTKLGNRPVMYNDHKKIGGHCIVNNLDLIDISLFKEIIK